ncbi:hypothetical protein [Halocatena halophila]|uniref:hypothetical protein n=1 Tax=Halocatena halophila TaxID=2814576 RepID=UPI002ED2DCF8
MPSQTRFGDLHGVERDLLLILAGSGPHSPSYLKSTVSVGLSTSLTYRRLYSHLNGLLEAELVVANETTDGVSYAITDAGVATITNHHTWLPKPQPHTDSARYPGDTWLEHLGRGHSRAIAPGEDNG